MSLSFARLLAIVVGSVTLLLISPTGAQDLAYLWKAGQKFSYDVNIFVDGDDEEVTYQGVVHYEVASANANQSSVTYRGGLRESKRTKRQRNPGRFGPFGPRGFPPMGGPFARPTFGGTRQTTNKITITPQGAAVAMVGQSQLPYLLGNVSLLPFEPLPKNNQRQWKSDSGVSITEEDEGDRHRFGPFGPMGPFASRGNSKVQAAQEVSAFKIARNEGKLVVVDKTYRLETPPAGDNPGFEMIGQGTWTFDKVDHVPHAYDMQLSLRVMDGNTTTKLPITVKYERLSAEKLAEMEAAATKKAEELAKAAAQKRELAQRPLTADERRQALADLNSGNPETVRAALNRLAEKSLQDPDAGIVKAISNHLSSTDRRVSAAAHSAMVKWDPEYAARKKLEKAYQGPSPVSSTDLYVESTTPLFVGQIVQAQRPRHGSFWRPARIKTLLDDGRVELAFLTWGKENKRDVVAVARRNIQLAPPELEQPDRPRRRGRTPFQVANEESGKQRTWTDKSGKYKLEAVFINVTGQEANFRRADGKTVSIRLDLLSDSDRAHIDRLQEADENPFKVK